MPEEKYPRVNFRLSERLLASLTERLEEGQTRDSVAKRDLERYYALLARSLPSFSEQEALLLCQVLNGSRNSPETIHRLWIEVQEELEERSPEGIQSEVIGRSFVARLKKLSPLECMAIADAVERYWLGAYHKDPAESRDRLREVGFVRD